MIEKKKVTEFEGYMSGDYECFCLCKIPFQEWVEQNRKLSTISLDDRETFDKWHKETEGLTLYPDDFFPEECEIGKWKFKIIVEVTKVSE